MVNKNALTTATALLARREHSRRELTQKLIRRFTTADIETALNRLQEKNLLNNQRFACAYVREAGRKFGDIKLRHYLRERGVTDDDIDHALKTEISIDEYDRAAGVLQKKYRVALSDAKTRAQASRFLLSRGFSRGTVTAVISDHKNGEPFSDKE
ncbi:recombination regulator RecX [Candidatus Persebacteraceae bacterium Df01]|jgi:regulatory protein|uniref:Regulatory protein RecX n=1 Tax=Candidatus Doriopsillibacter californiensis TaxID=2970740 RepID=A0ABT7QK65_9GAMM|nr:recombination regulator RecX [Candidatus Persebacteraceae bacterium Df01]